MLGGIQYNVLDTEGQAFVYFRPEHLSSLAELIKIPRGGKVFPNSLSQGLLLSILKPIDWKGALNQVRLTVFQENFLKTSMQTMLG
jgi:hypothetical protein